jgi:hypothetical protein
MSTRLRRLFTCLLVTLAVTTQGIAGAAMATQMASSVLPVQAAPSTSCKHAPAAKAHDHLHHDKQAQTSNIEELAGHSCESSHQTHVKCAGCLMFCSGLSVVSAVVAFANEPPSFIAPKWIAPQIPSPVLRGPLRPPQTPLS